MKIAYFTDTFLPQVNGIATSLANQARELGEQGHQILIFTPKLDDIPRQKFKAKNVTVVHLPTVPALIYTEYKFGVFGLPRVLKNLYRFDPDIIHLHSPFTVGMDAVMSAKLLKKPLVGTVHIYFTNSEYLKWLKYDLAVKLLDKVSQGYLNFLYGQCDLVLAPSKALVDELSKNGFKKPILQLPNSVTIKDPKILSVKEKQEIKKKYSLKEKVILHFGRISHEKSIDVVIKAFKKIAKDHQDVSLLIIGDGPATKKLKKLVKELRIEKNVIFTGFVDHQYLISSGLLSIGDVFVTASAMENQPMVVLEAMVFGLPIVGVQAAGLIELVGENGCLSKTGDVDAMAKNMEDILYNPITAKTMKEHSLEKVKAFSAKTITTQLLKLYQDLI